LKLCKKFKFFTFIREYVQPQWVYDCLNNALLLSVKEYAPGKILPPHLSPFVISGEEDHVPERQKEIEQIKKKGLFNKMFYFFYLNNFKEKGKNVEEKEEDEEEEVEVEEKEVFDYEEENKKLKKKEKFSFKINSFN